MPRDMTAAYLAAIQSGILRPVLFVEATFTSGPIYVWSGIGTIVWGGNTWVGIGNLGSISTIEEGSAVSAKGITLTLSGSDPTLLTGVTAEFQVGLPALVWLGVYDENGVLIGNPVC